MISFCDHLRGPPSLRLRIALCDCQNCQNLFHCTLWWRCGLADEDAGSSLLRISNKTALPLHGGKLHVIFVLLILAYLPVVSGLFANLFSPGEPSALRPSKAELMQADQVGLMTVSTTDTFVKQLPRKPVCKLLAYTQELIDNLCVDATAEESAAFFELDALLESVSG